MRSKRQKAYQKGHFAEIFAAFWLFFRGYRIVCRRFRCPSGEIDLIIRRGTVIAFVEVKARKNLDAGLNAISAEAKHRISAAGTAWISQQKDHAALSWRFDVVIVRPWALPTHFKDVW